MAPGLKGASCRGHAACREGVATGRVLRAWRARRSPFGPWQAGQVLE